MKRIVLVVTWASILMANIVHRILPLLMPVPSTITGSVGKHYQWMTMTLTDKLIWGTFVSGTGIFSALMLVGYVWVLALTVKGLLPKKHMLWLSLAMLITLLI